MGLPCIKIFFFLFLKTDFLFSEKRILQAVGITEPHVEMHFPRRFSYFSTFLKTDFLFSEKRILQAVGITEPPVEMHFHRRFSYFLEKDFYRRLA